MKILIVQSHIGGGGAERVGVLIASGLAQRGHEVYIVTNLHDEVKYPVNEKVKVLNMVTSPHNKLMKWGSAIKILRRYVKQVQPDVIIGIMQLSSFIAKLATIGKKVPIVMTEHYAFDLAPFREMTLLEKFCKFHLNKIYTHVTVLTEEDKKVIGDRLHQVSVMPNPLSLRPVDEVLSRGNVILAAGRIDGWHSKGFDVLIKAWGKLIQNSKLKIHNDGWRLQIAGTGSDTSLAYLKGLCKEYGVEDSVDFLGFVPDMQSLYQKASIFVLSSRYEGFGLVLIEAMSQGCACIACDHKGRQREIMENESQGLLCPPENIETLSRCMYKMIKDVDYRESVRKNAIERSKFFSIENPIERWEKLLNQIVKN